MALFKACLFVRLGSNKWKERYKQKFRRRVVARMNACENITRLSRERGVSRGLLYTWRYRLEPPDAEVEGTVSTQNPRESRLRREVNKLKRLLADKTIIKDPSQTTHGQRRVPNDTQPPGYHTAPRSALCWP
jgi:Transposase